MDDTPRVKLKRLKIDRYRTIKPGTELHFSDGINVLLGKNGTGKTTLLNLLAMVVRGNFHEVRDEELALEFDLGDVEHPGTWSVQVSNEKVAKERRPTRRKTEARTPPHLKARYQITYRDNGGKGPKSHEISSQEDDSFVILELDKNKIHRDHLKYDVNPFNKWNMNVVNTTNFLIEGLAHEDFFHLFPENINRLDEARDWLKTVFNDEVPFVTFGLRRPHFDSDSRLFPFDMAESLKNVFLGNRTSVSLVADTSSIPSFQKIVEALGYANGQVVLEQTSSDTEQS